MRSRGISRWKYRLLDAFAAVLCFSGVNAYFRWRNRRKSRILYYHGVVEDDFPRNLNTGGRQVASRNFKRQMGYLARKYHLLTLGDLVQKISDKTDLPRHSAIVTFDDGYSNNLRCAYPILKELGIPATIFLTTAYIDRPGVAWFDRVDILLASAKKRRFRIKTSEGEESFDAREGGGSAAPRLQDLLRGLDEEERSGVLEKLEMELGSVDTLLTGRDLGFLSWGQVEEMSREGLVGFGAHSTAHQYLPSLADADFEEDAHEARRVVEERIGRSVADYCYPYGAYTEKSGEILRRAGYRSAVTTAHGLVNGDSDLFRLSRLGMQDELGFFTFCCSVSGLLNEFIRLKARFKRAGTTSTVPRTGAPREPS